MRIESENQIKIHIIRHGKTLLNERHCYIGTTDDSLSKNGINEIKEKFKLSMYPDADKIFVSPMKRTIETAKIIYEGKPIILVDDFKETDFGSFEGKNYEELKNNPFYRRWIDEAYGIKTDEHDDINYSYEKIILPEKIEDVNKRVRRGFIDVLKQSCDDEEIAIVAHGGTIASICSLYSDENYYKFMTPCAEGISIEITYGIDKNGTVKISCFSITDRIHT